MTYRKSPDFVVLSEEPFNGQPALGRLLAADPVTPYEDHFVRCHGAIPRVDRSDFRLEVGGMVERPLTLRLSDLEANFLEVEQAITLQSAAHRRDELVEVAPLPGELPWGAAAIGTAVWRGVPLAAVLDAVGVLDGAFHVELAGLDEVATGERRTGFAGSIPLEKALDPGVLLAYEMNGEPLPPVHGHPLRAVVPGYIGARSVKWLTRITLQTEPSSSPFQGSYALYPKAAREDTAGRYRGLELGELALTSAIVSPADGAEVAAGEVGVRGYALAGGERTVERVEVSADHGRRWTQAELEPAPPGVWTWWHAELELGMGGHQLVCRAWDSAANTQPEELDHVWSFRGYMNTAWHRVRVWAE